MKLVEIIRFEVVYQLRRPATWIYFLTLCVLLLLVISEVADYARTVEHVTLSSPLMLAEIAGYANKFGFFVIALLAADGAMRDQQSRMDALMFTTSLKKASYLGGRYAGTVCLCLLLLGLAVPLSLFIGRLVLDLDPALFRKFNASGYVSSILYITVPNVLIATLISYTAVLMSRQATAAFVGASVLLALSTFTLEISAGNWALAKLLDPSGIMIVNSIGDSLSPSQRVKAGFQLTGSLLANRMLWLAVGIIAGAIAFLRFRMEHSLQCGTIFKRGERRVTQRSTALVGEGFRQTIVKVVPPSSDSPHPQRVKLTQVLTLTLRFCADIMGSSLGLLIPILAIYTFILIPNMAGGPMGVPILPTTERVILFLNNAALEIFVAMMVSLLAGWLIWRERDARLNEIADAMPVSDLVLILSKYLALALVMLILAFALIIAGIFIQLTSGYQELDIILFIKMVVGVQLMDFLLFAVVAFALHVVIDQKYIAHLAVLCFYLYSIVAPRYVTDHKLLTFGSDTGFAKSIFYDQSAFIFPWIMYKVYWLGWTLLIFVIARGMWVRGRETALSSRIINTGKILRKSILMPVGLVIILSSGGVIFYNSYILNEYSNVGERIAAKAEYELKYGRFEKTPQPSLTGTTLNIELYPDDRSAVVQGIYYLKNSTRGEIHSVHLVTSNIVDTYDLKFSKAGKFSVNDERLGYWIYRLNRALYPGDSITLNFTVKLEAKGIPNGGIRTEVMNNGTYLSNDEWFPSIGYQPGRELDNEGDREDHRLPRQAAYPSNKDTGAIMRSGRGKIQFEATIGTSPHQTALAPGRLTKTWLKHGRKYFHYQTGAPIHNKYHIYSAKYALKSSKWKGVDLQIYHHPRSTLNLGGIEKSMKASLDYYTANFGPYPYTELRFVEYADAGTGGISLPGSVGYSTNYAMLNSARDKRGFDLPFAVAAHEIAHQWWPHQLNTARVAGDALMTESLSWYSAFGVIEQTYGTRHLRSLLNAMRADYLDPRARAGTPLLEANEKFQGYRKGPLAMYALREYIGENVLNSALRNLLQKFTVGDGPHATSLDLYSELQAVTPDSLHYLLKDLFEKNTYWDLKTAKVTVTQVLPSEWQVTMVVFAGKVVVDKNGTERKQKMNDLVEIGVFNEDEKGENILYLRKHRLRAGANVVAFKVSQKPGRAGVDPRNLLVDMEMGDNVKIIEN